MSEELPRYYFSKKTEFVIGATTVFILFAEPFFILPFLARQDELLKTTAHVFLICCTTPFALATLFLLSKASRRQKLEDGE